MYAEIPGEDTGGGAPMEIKAIKQEMGRRSFLKLGLSSIAATVLLLAAGCVGGGDDDDDDDDDDDESRRRRRRRR
jgi:hypothetical protein